MKASKDNIVKLFFHIPISVLCLFPKTYICITNLKKFYINTSLLQHSKYNPNLKIKSFVLHF